ncbi:RHS repeat-associated core domain-containing protein [Pseudomonas sp. B5(2017)]|uniref:RHS repeat-associated core domain-containing protein n=1 Tax=Pseudomonas sp. B5(2017) TaxID=1981714 RepID=UPI000A1E7CFE|nr:RHS repeat-associated core domain-containing protein [Pseudomonas sp. B5(2017)]
MPNKRRGPTNDSIAHPRTIAYTPFGYCMPVIEVNDHLRFNGEWLDTLTGLYFLGLGYRAFSPVLLRFSSPDTISPFGAGGLNSYVYCLNDPINLSDPEGTSALGKLWTRIRGLFHKQKIAYHGTSIYSEELLLNGLKKKYMRTTSHYGEGFYITTDKDYARWYAGSADPQDPGVIVGVYTNNVNKLVKGKDFDYAEKNSMVIRPSAYHKITIRKLNSEDKLHRRNSYYERRHLSSTNAKSIRSPLEI